MHFLKKHDIKIICSSSRESFVNELYPFLSRKAPLWYKNEACGVNGNEHTYRSAASRQSGIGDKKTPHQYPTMPIDLAQLVGW